MNTHRQLSILTPRISAVVTHNVSFNGKRVSFITVCQIDKFFDQPQNKSNLGWIDTSPYAASTPSAEQHVMPLQGGRKSSQMLDEDLFDTTVSKHCQTLSEVSNLARSLNRPVADDFAEPEPPAEPAQPVSTE